ncbi:MAG: hypothetical protein HYZ91_04895 [Candidatus Omnitrophica bacterium]|nr:hypothetical protein [Candidatus Omnitrophota bacterium]
MDGFSQRQAMGDFAQDHWRGERANLAGGGTVEQHGATSAPFEDVVYEYVCVKKDRPAGRKLLEHLKVPEANSVGGRQFQYDSAWDLDELPGGFDLVERSLPSQNDHRIVGQRQLAAQLERSISIHGLDNLSGHQALRFSIAHYSTMRVAQRQIVGMDSR